MPQEPLDFMICEASKYEREYIEAQDFMVNRIMGSFLLPLIRLTGVASERMVMRSPSSN